MAIEIAEIEECVFQTAANIYKKDAAALTRDTNIAEELGTKSLNLISMISLVGDEFDVVISNRDAMQFKTLGELIDYVAEEAEE